MFISGNVAPAQTDAAADEITNARSFREEYENTRCKIVSCLSRFEASHTMNSLPLEFIDFIHAENLLSHDSQLVFKDTAGDMLTIPKIEVVPGTITQRFIRHDSSKTHLSLWVERENLRPVGRKLAVLH
jgi:hypothetical protein